MQKIKDFIDDFLIQSGLSETLVEYVSFLIFLAAILIMVLTAIYLTRVFLYNTIGRLAKTYKQFDFFFSEHNFLKAVAMMSGIIVLKIAVPVLFEDMPKTMSFMHKVIDIFLLYIIIRLLIILLTVAEKNLLNLDYFKEKPISSYFQLSRIILTILGIILAMSIMFSKSPVYFFGAFGAMAALLLLIFKDTILGLVASVQISANDMIRIGDWVEMSKFDANGTVIAINLNTVKISNFDKTISTVPTYYFVTESFKNWRGMQESGGRRIKRTLLIDVNSVRFVDAEMREGFKKIELIKDYIVDKQLEIDKHNQTYSVDTSLLINGRRMTNLGVFRIYVTNYLKKHPRVNQEMTLMVRQMTPTENGIPLEVYCFANTVKWLEYEPIQADIFDHLFATIPFFGLKVFQNPTGKDLISVLNR